MTRSARAVGIIALVLVALLVGSWAQLEWVEIEVDTGHGPEALRNGFLAAERFLNAQGVETETVEGVALFDALPPVEDALMITAPRESLSPRRRDAVVEWVEAGGVLFAVAHSVYDFESEASADGLLDALGLFLVDPDDEVDETEADGDGEGEAVGEAAHDDDATESPAEDEATKKDAEGEEQDLPETFGELLSLAFAPPACREDDGLDRVSISAPIEAEMVLELDGPYALRVAESQLEDAYFSEREQLIALRYGEGLVVTLTTAAPFTNRRIHCHDHAWFLWYAVEDRRKVWLLHDPDAPGLHDLAMAHLPGTTIGLGVLILLASARASLRFGLAEPSGRARRRGRLAHLEASARFQHRRGGFGALYRRLRDDLASRGPADRAAWAARSGVSASRLAQVFGGDTPRRRREVVERVATMIRMRRTR